MKIHHGLLPKDFPEVRTFWIGRNHNDADDYDGDSICFYTGDSAAHHAANSEQLRAILGADCIVQPRQVHSSNIEVITADNCDTPVEDTDAVITSTPKIVIGVNTADCVPLLIYDSENKIAAAVHAGWRGTVARITGKVIDALIAMGASATNLYCHIGVAISGENYEVGEDVVLQFSAANHDVHTFTKSASTPGKYLLDLKEANKQQLLAAGIPEENISISETCTFYSPMCYSARRQGIASGRNFTGIMLR